MSGIAADDRFQQRAWEESLIWLAAALETCVEKFPNAERWGLCLEFKIPRRGYRIDAVILAAGLVIPIEFKTVRSDASVTLKAEDYGHELADFHEGSQKGFVAPILCSSGAQYHPPSVEEDTDRSVVTVTTTDPGRLADAILALHNRYSGDENIELSEWLRSSYRPTPTIIGAANALYTGYSVEDLTKAEASAEQLKRTRESIVSMAHDARRTGAKTICFVTGIPGAGKILAGLDAVHSFDEGRATFCRETVL